MKEDRSKYTVHDVDIKCIRCKRTWVESRRLPDCVVSVMQDHCESCEEEHMQEMLDKGITNVFVREKWSYTKKS